MFYENLQDHLNTIPLRENIVLLGAMNARVDNEAILEVKQRFNESVKNYHGYLLTNFCTLNELRINNTFFNHKPQHKYTWWNSRG